MAVTVLHRRPGAEPVPRPVVDRLSVTLLPGLAVLRTSQRGWWRPELAGMPPAYGFYAVLAPLVLYALVGTSRHLGVGPERRCSSSTAAALGLRRVAVARANQHVVRRLHRTGLLSPEGPPALLPHDLRRRA